MNKAMLFSIFFILCNNIFGQTECEVKQLFEPVEPNSDIKVLTTDDEISDLTEVVQLILSPLSLDKGKYQIELSRKGSDIYKVNGEDIYIETQYCYEYASYQEAILIIESNYGYSKGKVIFLD